MMAHSMLLNAVTPCVQSRLHDEADYGQQDTQAKCTATV